MRLGMVVLFSFGLFLSKAGALRGGKGGRGNDRAKPDLQLATASAIRSPALPQQPSCEIDFRFASADFVAEYF